MITPKWGFEVAMLPVGALCFYQARSGRTCFQNGHFGRISSTLYFTMFQSLGGHASARRVSHKPCFRQALCFVRGPLRPQIPHLDGRNRQLPIASVQRTQSTLAGHSAVPRGTSTTPMNANRSIRIAAQRTQGLRGPNSVFLGRNMTANER